MKPTSEGTASTARVIVADDEAVIRMGLRRMLEDAGYQIIGEASTADEVFDLAEGRTADAVLLGYPDAGDGHATGRAGSGQGLCAAGGIRIRVQ